MTSSRTLDQANPQPYSRGLAGTSLDLPALLEQLADLLGPITGSAPMMVFLIDPASNRYTPRYTRDLAVQATAGCGLDSKIARRLGAHDQPLHLVDGQDGAPSSPLTDEDMQALEGMVLFMPLRGEWGVPEGRPRGWVALGPRPAGEPYSSDDLHLMAALADQAALTIENSYLLASVAELEQANIEFLDFVAHELKQPMTSMQGYAKMLTLGIGGEMNERQGQFLQVITANVDRMGKMVNDLLEISRLEAGRTTLKPERLQPKEVVDQALDTIQADVEARGHALEVQVPGDLPPVTVDRDRLLQILNYLLSNACMYTPNGGTIRVSASEPDPAAGPPGHLQFSIRDTGIGISAEDLARLGKFFRADHDLVVSQPGTGLGIAIARGLIELHGGELTIESEPDRGSTFSFSVPIAQGDGA